MKDGEKKAKKSGKNRSRNRSKRRDKSPPRKRRRKQEEDEIDLTVGSDEDEAVIDSDNDNGDEDAGSEGEEVIMMDDGDNMDDSKPAAAAATKTKASKPVATKKSIKELSKWASRLFDPDRPKGLVAPPEIIPLNDEYLQAFGRREKKFHAEVQQGKQAAAAEDQDNNELQGDLPFEVNQPIQDDSDADSDDQDDELMKSDGGISEKSKSWSKVKISNLAFRTTDRTLKVACQMYGPIQKLNLIMDKTDSSRNAGRAYVTFETADAGQDCVDGLTQLDGRPLTVVVTNTSDGAAGPSTGGGSGAAVYAQTRYWEKDISTKCFRCGEIGHMEAQCTNERKARICPLCAEPGHDPPRCQYAKICFNCGKPGHINRDCPHQRGSVQRTIVCGICLQLGHHRMQCREKIDTRNPHPLEKDAICMFCHQKGHFLCKEIKSYYGVHGVSCFNCGTAGHTGYECKRPNIDQCQRNHHMGAAEVDRAGVISFAEQLEWQQRFNEQTRQQEQQQRGRSMQRGGYDGRDNDSGNRRGGHRSMPPPQQRDSRQRSQSTGGSGRRNDGGRRRGY